MADSLTFSEATHRMTGDISQILSIRLNELRLKSPQRFHKPVYVLSTIDGTKDKEWERRLIELKQEHPTEQILLIPYKVTNEHWIGVLLEFQANGQLIAGEWIDPLHHSTFIPDQFQKIFSRHFPQQILKSKQMLYDEDPKRSAILTVTNLLDAAVVTRKPVIPTVDQGKSIEHRPEDDEEELRLAQMKDSLSRRLASANVEDIHTLAEKIQRSQQRIEDFRADQREEDARDEEKRLREFLGLKQLVDEIDQLEKETPNEFRQLKQLETSLKEKLQTLNVGEVSNLIEKIERTERRISDDELDGRDEDVKRGKDLLKQLREAKSIADQIESLKSSPTLLNQINERRLRQLQEDLTKGFNEHRVENFEQLKGKIERTRKRIRDDREDQREESAIREEKILRELEKLVEIHQQIVALDQQVNSDQNKLRRLEKSLESALKDRGIADVPKLLGIIERSKRRIEDYRLDRRNEEAEEENRRLIEYQKLSALVEQIEALKSSRMDTPFDHSAVSFVRDEPQPGRTTTDPVAQDNLSSADLFHLSKDRNSLPLCAEKIALDLLIDLVAISTANARISEEQREVFLGFHARLKSRLQEEDLWTGKIRNSVDDLEEALKYDRFSAAINGVRELLKKIRPLNVAEIERLVAQTKDAAQCIEGKEIVLFIGTTGSGKSTTIQCLAGEKMKAKKVEFEPGLFLDHIEIDGVPKNPRLKGVISNPRNRAETRFIFPVEISLREVLGRSETKEMILCDAPGFGDTSGPEVDIANGVGVIDALKKCKSVKILALSSYIGLGDRAEGIQKLANILIGMIDGIDQRMNSIVFGFTKYPSEKRIHDILADKRTRVDENDTALVSVLSSMIRKTRHVEYKINPLSAYPVDLVEELKEIQGISTPGEVFRFSISDETNAAISQHLHRTKMAIDSALTHRDVDFLLHQLKTLKTLKDLLKQGSVLEAYEHAIDTITKKIEEFCDETMNKFSRALDDQNGFQDEDIRSFQSAVDYLKRCQKLGKHLEAKLIPSNQLFERMQLEFQTRSSILTNEMLESPAVGLFLNNCRRFATSFEGLRSQYKEICRQLRERLEELVRPIYELILAYQFQDLVKILLKLWKMIPTLGNHLEQKVEESYKDCVKFLLQHLNGFSAKAKNRLEKSQLNENDLNMLRTSIEILRNAKEDSTLQDRVLNYLELVKEQKGVLSGFSADEKPEEQLTDLNEIYLSFVKQIVKHFDTINEKVKDLLEKGKEQALEDVERLIEDMDQIRAIPEIESRTAGVYYRTVESVRVFMQQWQRETEQILFIINNSSKSETIDYARHARTFLRLKSAEWMNRKSPGTYDGLIRHIKEELLYYAEQSETRLTKLDFTLRSPNNVAAAFSIVESIESISNLERIVPELTKYRERIEKSFLQTIQETFDRIQSTFNLQTLDVYQMKQQLRDLEQMKRDYEGFSSSHLYLKSKGFSSIEVLNRKIEEISKKQEANLKIPTDELQEIVRELSDLNRIVREYEEYSSERSEQTGFFQNMLSAVHRSQTPAEKFLRSYGFSTIEAVRQSIEENQRKKEEKSRSIEMLRDQFRSELEEIESIREEFRSLSNSQRSISSEQKVFLEEKEKESIEKVEEEIEEFRRSIVEMEKKKQSYNFNRRFDVSTANNALLYVIQCDQVDLDGIRETATDTKKILKNYVDQYGSFLEKEIQRTFQSILNIRQEKNPSEEVFVLETRFQELISLQKFPEVFQCIEGTTKIEDLHRQFRENFRRLSMKMTECSEGQDTNQLRHQLVIAQALSCLDRFVDDLRENGFAALYSRYRVEITKQARDDYINVLKHIDDREYAKADMALPYNRGHSLNLQDERQIQHDLKNSLNKLMRDTKSIANWLDGKIEREEDNQKQVDTLKDNIDRIRAAVNKQGLLKLLDKKTREDLENFDQLISEQLSSIILKSLNCIEDYMDGNNFSEAQQGIESLSRVQRELVSYFSSTDIIAKTEELRVKMGTIVDQFCTDYESADIDSYPVNSPKELLMKLKQVAAPGSARYKQAYTTIYEKVRVRFSEEIEKLRNKSADERSMNMQQLNYSLFFLPDELQGPFRKRIEELNNTLNAQEERQRKNLEVALENMGGDDQSVSRISNLAQQYNAGKQTELLDRLNQEVVRKLQTYRSSVEHFLDIKDIPSALRVIDQIAKYRAALVSKPVEVDPIYQSVLHSMNETFKSLLETISSIERIEKEQIIQSAFENIITFLSSVCSGTGSTRVLLYENSLKKAATAFDFVTDFLQKNSRHFEAAIQTVDVGNLQRTLIVAKRWDHFLKQIKDCQPVRHTLVQNLLVDVEPVMTMSQMCDRLGILLGQLKKQINVDFIDDDRTKFEAKRDEFFRSLSEAINHLREIETTIEKLLAFQVKVDLVEDDLKKKVLEMGDHLLSYASKNELTQRDADQFRLYHNYISSFDKHIHFQGFNPRRFLEQAEEKIFEKVSSSISDLKSSTSDAKLVGDALEKIKSLAQNLPMLRGTIKVEIDEALKFYKGKEGAQGIMRLTMILEKTEMGSLLISDHATLAGEDWRKRREKMQNQDNLDYVLGELDGDDLCREGLTIRYQIFREKYDIFISTAISAWDQKKEAEPKIDSLIAHTHHLVGKITKKTDDEVDSGDLKIWTQTVKDNIPELMACIFAVWTLKNTRYYDTARGIEKAESYLLMPHVAQIVAIFRIFGLGYAKKDRVPIFHFTYRKTISDDLVNNLVEIGTGEGKSVVMAVVASVFALLGVNVSCSCYSEVLSARDQNDFAPVFQAFGIEKRIEYGTFNRLCENLLNEQCNIRERVREMILTNAARLEVTKIMTFDSPKVLLIDEVDVFLSERFYGGMYTPSVFLKNALIKKLIDAIWTNRQTINFNRTKNLDEYKACANEYSHWMFLFDEAIKDMLAALQSYQSSTYKVQNDKIVYVEGESITEHVVRGYDTVWAYYHEFQQGRITQGSLDANVGILINCGTFSYAEMPHEFSYITGVTGTLRTLADAEREILREVYAVERNTYLPSVFGKHNRTYDPRTDVIALDESQYFMRIVEEINRTVDAKRAILVFFESEEKLTEFFHSPHLAARKSEVQIISESVSEGERDMFIKRAASVRSITLLTRIFGRGTDFVCRNPDLLLSGGIHVLQTFFSEELSEEYQIRGRGARQGDSGSYRMFLLKKDLEWVLGSTWKETLEEIPQESLYNHLKKKRQALYDSKCAAKQVGIKQCQHEHNASKQFMKNLCEGNFQEVQRFLGEQNRGANILSGTSRTVVLMDATASMSPLLTATKETVLTMFERAAKILETHGFPPDAFRVQFVVYRDYDCKEELLQSSSWETKPMNLRNFISKIRARGGGDFEEAVEIGLWHAAEESDKEEGISQVILIADAPAKDVDAIEKDRQTFGGEKYWAKTKFKVPTHFQTELRRLVEKKIPVHTLFLHPLAEENFRFISEQTGGSCGALDIYSTEGAEMLTHFVTEQVLRKTGGQQGEDLVEIYRRDHVRTTHLARD